MNTKTYKLNKKEWEAKLRGKIGGGFTKRLWDEGAYGSSPARMTLYYKKDVHIGTWQDGKCWFTGLLRES